MRKSVPFFAVLAIFALAFSARAAIFLNIDGIKGDSTARNHPGAVTALRFNLEIVAPHDIATGQGSGKTLFKPLIITREIDAVSPQLFHALITNEHIKSLTLELVKPSPDGKESAYYTVKLQNVSISNFRQYTEETSGRSSDLEEISFTYEKIEVEAAAGQSPSGKSEIPAIKIPSSFRPPNK